MSERTKRIVPVLITWDVDPDSWLPAEKRKWALETALDLCQQRSIPATFFFTAKLAETYQDKFDLIQSQGHEIGCHGLTHGIEENYDDMPEDMQRTYIAQATEKLQNLTQDQIRAFRSPRVKTSATTLRLLSEHGYTVDSSVCSQRLDLVSSNLVNVGWLFAPRHPYHPRADSAFRKGDVRIWEVPVSALVMPFISSALKVFGLSAMKALFKLLHIESLRTGRPIVYLAHPTEFSYSEKRGGRLRAWRQFVNFKYLKPSYIRAHGLRMRNLLYKTRGDRLAKHTQQLFEYIASFPTVQFLTISDYVERLLGEP